MSQPNKNLPTLKPGNQSSEYAGKVTAQTLLGLIALANIILEYLGHPPVLLTAETAALIAVGLEALWGVFRQTNKAIELHTQGAVRIAELDAGAPPVNVSVQNVTASEPSNLPK